MLTKRSGLASALALVAVLVAQQPTQAWQTPDAPIVPIVAADPSRAAAGRVAGGETLVTASRASRALDEPQASDTISSRELRERGYRTLPQAFRDMPGVMVQETAHGQGSPFIRGFTGFRNLLMIDGIRLNHSAFRDGPNQYWNTVDPFSLERLEVVRGPSSVRYGSDAIGGTVNAITRSPYSYGAGVNAGGGLLYRHATAERSNVGRGELSVTSGVDLGLLVGGTLKSFGDLEGGRETGTQPETGYDEWNADVKGEAWLDEHMRLTVAYQRTRQDEVPRTHRTIHAIPFKGTSVGSDLSRDLDQERELAYVQLHGDQLRTWLIDGFHASLSFHRQEELRDRVRGSGARDTQGFEVGTLGLFTHLTSETPIGELTWGIDYYHDDVDSFSSGNAVQGPVADDASYYLAGAFVEDRIAATERVDVTLGARFQYARADANRVLDPVTATATSLEDSWKAFVGSVRAIYRVTEDTVRLFGGVSQGFRAPNLSDLTRFDSARTNEFEIPAPGLEAEEYLSYELGIKSETATASTQLAVFYTDIKDQIVRFPTGNTNASGEFEITKANIGDGYVWGIELGAAGLLAPEWTLFGNATLLYGRVDTFPDSTQTLEREYIDRLMPFTSQLGVRWEALDQRQWVELVGVYADDADRLSTRDAGDTSRIPPGGTPGYLVFHVRFGRRLSEHARVDLTLENLLDEDYRVHGSGQNMPGLNAVVALALSW